MSKAHPVVYVAGPMTGYALHNFPAFDTAATFLRENGYRVINPAELTRKLFQAVTERPFDPTVYDTIEKVTAASGLTYADFLREDLKAITGGDVEKLAFLPGWRRSHGATSEAFVGRLLDLQAGEFSETLRAIQFLPGELFWSAEDEVIPRTLKGIFDDRIIATQVDCAAAVNANDDRDIVDSKNVLAIADALVDGSRQQDYGHPLDNFLAVEAGAKLLGIDLPWDKVPLLLILLKLAREVQHHKDDNEVDIAGYIKTRVMAREELGRRTSAFEQNASPTGAPTDAVRRAINENRPLVRSTST